jgi:hypothetical protein
MLHASPPTPSTAELRFFNDKKECIRSRTWLPRRDGGWDFYHTLQMVHSPYRPFTWIDVEVHIPGIGVAVGILDKPFTVLPRHGMPFEAMVSPEADEWTQSCKWQVPRALQWRGFWRPRRYFLERTVTWHWAVLDPERQGDG